MDNQTVDYLRFLINNFPFLEKDIHHFWNYGSSEEPLTIFIFSRVGSSILKNFNLVDMKEKKALFECIEKGINSNSASLSTAVATGLIEAIVNRTNNEDEIWKKISELLGEKSLQHALAWRNFGQ